MLEIRDLPRTDQAAAGRLLGRTFVQDPSWRYMGPRWSTAHRRLVSTAFHRGEVWMCRRRQGWMLGAYEDGRFVGVTVAFPDGEAPPPFLYWITRTAAFVLGGPLPGARAGSLGTRMDKVHPKEPHVHCWLVASEPDMRGVGVALLKAITDRADALGKRCYLEATSPDLVSLYKLLGFEESGTTLSLATGDDIVLMWRDVGARGGRARRAAHAGATDDS